MTTAIIRLLAEEGAEYINNLNDHGLTWTRSYVAGLHRAELLLRRDEEEAARREEHVIRRPADGQRNPHTERVPEHVWHLSDSHGLRIMHGQDRWLEVADGNHNFFGRAELVALVNHLNDTEFSTY